MSAPTASEATPHLRTTLPGPRAAAVIARDEAASSPSLTRVYPLVVDRGEGCTIIDVDGNRFLDMTAGIAVTTLGHADADVTAAIEDQARRVVHYCSSDFYLPAHTEVVERLAALAPMPDARVFLANSGTEAVEAALKVVRHHTRRPNVIAFFGAFHGRTLGSLSLTASKSRQRGGFGVVTPGVLHAPYAGAGEVTGADYIDDVLFATLTDPDDVAAVVVEPIQGEGGYVVPPPGWLAALRDLCDRHGILLVVDEIQSGVGRTGTMWAVEHDGVVPDVMCVGKGLANGLPLSAMVARSSVMQWPPGSHGSTFGGNPVACAAAVVTLDRVRHGLAAHAGEVGSHLLARLRAGLGPLDVVTDVRGRGLMVGVELADGELAAAAMAGAFERGLLTLTCGRRCVRFCPPLVVTREEIDVAVDLFVDTCASLPS